MVHIRCIVRHMLIFQFFESFFQHDNLVLQVQQEPRIQCVETAEYQKVAVGRKEGFSCGMY
jgi:hypothetical protein